MTVKHFPNALDWGCNAGSVYKSLAENPQRASIGHLLQCDSTSAMLNRPDFPADHPRFKTSKRVVCAVLHRPPHGRRTSWQTRNEPAPTLCVAQVDDEAVPFEPESFDLIVSSMSLHWTNDLPGTPFAPHSAFGTSASTAPAFCVLGLAECSGGVCTGQFSSSRPAFDFRISALATNMRKRRQVS